MDKRKKKNSKPAVSTGSNGKLGDNLKCENVPTKIGKTYCMDDCLLSDSSLSLWGYPIPTPVTVPAPVTVPTPVTVLTPATSVALRVSLPDVPDGSHEILKGKRNRDIDSLFMTEKTEMNAEVGGQISNDVDHDKKKIRTDYLEVGDENVDERGSAVAKKVVDNLTIMDRSNVVMMSVGENLVIDSESNSNNNAYDNGNGKGNRRDGDDMHMGVIKGNVPLNRETQRIFCQMYPTHSSSSTSYTPEEDLVNQANIKLKVEFEMQNNGCLLFPLLNVTVQATRGSPQNLKLAGYRSTVSSSSNEFQFLFPIGSEIIKRTFHVAITFLLFPSDRFLAER